MTLRQRRARTEVGCPHAAWAARPDRGARRLLRWCVFRSRRRVPLPGRPAGAAAFTGVAWMSSPRGFRGETSRISCVGSVAIELGVPVGRRPGIRVRKRIEFAPQRPLQADGSRAGAEDRGGGTEHRLPIGVAGRAGVAPVCGRACGIEPTSEAAGSRSAHVRVSAVVAATGANWITSLYRVATPV